MVTSARYNSSWRPSQQKCLIVPERATVDLFGTVSGPSGRVARSANGSLTNRGLREDGRPKTPLLTGPEPALRAWHGRCLDGMDEVCDALERPARRKSTLPLSSSLGSPESTCQPVWPRSRSLRLLSVRTYCVDVLGQPRRAGARSGVDSVTHYQQRTPSRSAVGNPHPDPTGTVGCLF